MAEQTSFNFYMDVKAWNVNERFLSNSMLVYVHFNIDEIGSSSSEAIMLLINPQSKSFQTYPNWPSHKYLPMLIYVQELHSSTMVSTLNSSMLLFK